MDVKRGNHGPNLHSRATVPNLGLMLQRYVSWDHHTTSRTLRDSGQIHQCRGLWASNSVFFLTTSVSSAPLIGKLPPSSDAALHPHRIKFVQSIASLSYQTSPILQFLLNPLLLVPLITKCFAALQ